MAQHEVIRCPKEEFERKVEEKFIEGYEIKTKDERLAILEIEGGWGKWWIHMCLLIATCWTYCLVGLILCAVYAYKTQKSEKKILHIKIEEEK